MEPRQINWPIRYQNPERREVHIYSTQLSVEVCVSYARGLGSPYTMVWQVGYWTGFYHGYRESFGANF